MFSEPSTVISARGLSKRYEIYDKPRDRLLQMLARGRRQLFREFWALRDVSFDIRRGETVGIVGRNGSGKSTLLQIVCGILHPTRGEIRVQGRVAALLELGAGFNPEFSGRENVLMAAQLLGLTEAQALERYSQIAAFADIGDFIDQPVKTYSSGMFVRLAFAVVAHVDADILVIDEALAVGDAYFTQKCMRFLRDFRERGTLLFVSHDAAAVVNLCDRAVWLDGGQVVMTDTAKSVMQSYLQDLYGAKGAAAQGMDGDAAESAAPELPALDSDEAEPHESTFSLEGKHHFGQGGAMIESVRLVNAGGDPHPWVMGDETVTLEVRAKALAPLAQPIVGFIVKDRLGQHLFGENTYRAYAAAPCAAPPGARVQASFTFRMPILPRGEYSIAVAVSDGTQADHVVHQWVHEALLFQSHADSDVTGLVGIPMQTTRLRLLPKRAETVGPVQ
jgi:lipopolysaccharide transport system ATP-binding protein